MSTVIAPPMDGVSSDAVLTRYDVIVVGGGPAGSACATKAVEAGLRTLVLDREVFPRTKLCAGWVTPEALAALDLDPSTYPHRFNTFDSIVVHLKGLSFKLAAPQHSIRRFEFDDYLLRRSGAEVARHNVKDIQLVDSCYRIDGLYEGTYLVGAGGTRCPVYRTFFRQHNPRAKELQAATYEHEFAYEWHDPRCHLWFFEHGLPGYAWYVPKQNGYLNCGIGGMAEKLKARGDDLRSHWRRFVDDLGAGGFVEHAELEPKGYSYYLRGDVHVVRAGNAFITGDAAGLATRDLCEGIGPAIVSGQRAAKAIVTGGDYSLEGVSPFSAERGWVRSLLEYMFVKRKPKSRPKPVRAAA